VSEVVGRKNLPEVGRHVKVAFVFCQIWVVALNEEEERWGRVGEGCGNVKKEIHKCKRVRKV